MSANWLFFVEGGHETLAAEKATREPYCYVKV